MDSRVDCAIGFPLVKDPSGTCSLGSPYGGSVCLLPGTQIPAGLATDMPHVYFCLSVLLLLALPSPISSWSRPPWYQVGLDLQPWGCQSNSVDGCEISLGCPGRWMGLGMNRIHPVAWLMGGTITVLMLGHTALRWRTQAQSEVRLDLGPNCPPRPACTLPAVHLHPRSLHSLWPVPYPLIFPLRVQLLVKAPRTP